MDDMYYLEASLGVPVKDIFGCILKMIKDDSNDHISTLYVKEVAKIIADCKKQESYPTGVDNSFDLLVDDVIEEIMLQLDRVSLANLCFSSKNLLRVCSKDTFKTKYSDIISSNLRDWLIDQGFPDEVDEKNFSVGAITYILVESEVKMVSIYSLIDHINLIIHHNNSILTMSFKIDVHKGYNKQWPFKLEFRSEHDDKLIYSMVQENNNMYVYEEITKNAKTYKFNGILKEEMFPDEVLRFMKETGLKKHIVGKIPGEITKEINSYIVYTLRIILQKVEENSEMRYDGKSISATPASGMLFF